MKTNLKLTKVTISKLDNLNIKPLENGELQNVKGGGEVTTFTNTATPSDTSNGTGPSGGGPVDIITIGGGWNDTSSYSSCNFNLSTYCNTKLS
ncbi:hypothetical protein [Flavobacterium sp. PS2]|uniref:hypothetical protein n=1 Tax=Flavobacterium sp. PS2 TaxID=3384157 RepID=UPI00390C6A72